MISPFGIEHGYVSKAAGGLSGGGEALRAIAAARAKARKPMSLTPKKRINPDTAGSPLVSPIPIKRRPKEFDLQAWKRGKRK